MWILRTVQGHEPVLTFRLMPGTIKTLGRAVRADFIVDAAMVSRLHCRLTAQPTGQLEVEVAVLVEDRRRDRVNALVGFSHLVSSQVRRRSTRS